MPLSGGSLLPTTHFSSGRGRQHAQADIGENYRHLLGHAMRGIRDRTSSSLTRLAQASRLRRDPVRLIIQRHGGEDEALGSLDA
jgi:hypothetical protein